MLYATNYGAVSSGYRSVYLTATSSELHAWATRSGQSWPCSYLRHCDRVCVTLDAENGDLIDLAVIENGRDSEALDLSGDELTAWIDDCLAATPFAHLAKNPAEVTL